MQQIIELVESFGGISFLLLAIILIWSGVWKLLALWKAARKGSVPWFVILGIVNTVGILEILYFFVFSECCDKKRKSKARKVRRKRRR